MKKIILTSLALLLACNVIYAAEKISRIFTPEMLGVETTYFEKISGSAKYKSGETRTYLIDGCSVFTENSGGKVNSLGMSLSKKCTFDLNKFFNGYNFPATNKMTFGDFEIKAGPGKFTASCLLNCGNAADPSVSNIWTGSRADGGIRVKMEVSLVDDPALNAADKWRSAILENESEQWIYDGKFNCGKNKYDQVANAVFKKVKFDTITIGSIDVNLEECK
jgi:hypothetical protein